MNETNNTYTRTIDQNELRTGQFLTVAMILTAFIINRWELVALQTIIFGLSVTHPILNPYHALYRFVLRPVGILRPDIREDNAEPSRFADLIGLFFSAVAAYLIFTGYAVIGWGMIWVMIMLGSIAFMGWCAGSFMYYLMNRLGLKGFFKRSPINGVFPGLRPPKSQN